MNLLVHLSYITVIDWLLFQYWFIFANRYTVLNFNESAFLPARYIMAGLLGGVFVYWLYLIPVSLFKRFSPGYWHPRWWLLWGTLAPLSGIQVFLTVRRGNPPLEVWVALVLVMHLLVLHFLTLMVADRITKRGDRTILPGVRPSLIFLGMWLFWIVYSYSDTPQGSPSPVIGSDTERIVVAAVIAILMGGIVVYRLSWDREMIPRDRVVFLGITVENLIDSFWSAWSLYYLLVPAVHYLLRGYVISHSTLFPSFLLGLVIPVGWSLGLMWGVLLVHRPELAWHFIRREGRAVILRMRLIWDKYLGL